VLSSVETSGMLLLTLLGLSTFFLVGFRRRREVHCLRSIDLGRPGRLQIGERVGDHFHLPGELDPLTSPLFSLDAFLRRADGFLLASPRWFGIQCHGELDEPYAELISKVRETTATNPARVNRSRRADLRPFVRSLFASSKTLNPSGSMESTLYQLLLSERSAS